MGIVFYWIAVKYFSKTQQRYLTLTEKRKGILKRQLYRTLYLIKHKVREGSSFTPIVLSTPYQYYLTAGGRIKRHFSVAPAKSSRNAFATLTRPHEEFRDVWSNLWQVRLQFDPSQKLCSPSRLGIEYKTLPSCKVNSPTNPSLPPCPPPSLRAAAHTSTL